MQTLVFASANPSKLRELTAILGELDVALQSQSQLGVTPIEENGMSFLENSLIKARHASKATGLPALGDDSGLVVDILDGAPGIYSARYAGVNASDDDNVKQLLEALSVHEGEQFSAHFHCVASYVHSPQDPIPIVAEAKWCGRIIAEPKGNNGFGYDPVFYVPELNGTVAELSEATKNRFSHRAKAFKKLCAKLQEL